MSDKLLAKRLLEALPDAYQLTEDDTRMTGALVNGNWSWSTTNGRFLGIVVADQPVQTAGDLRRVLATLPEPPADEDDGESAGAIFFDAIMKIIGPSMREIVQLRVKLHSGRDPRGARDRDGRRLDRANLEGPETIWRG